MIISMLLWNLRCCLCFFFCVFLTFLQLKSVRSLTNVRLVLFFILFYFFLLLCIWGELLNNLPDLLQKIFTEKKKTVTKQMIKMSSKSCMFFIFIVKCVYFLFKKLSFIQVPFQKVTILHHFLYGSFYCFSSCLQSPKSIFTLLFIETVGVNGLFY